MISQFKGRWRFLSNFASAHVKLDGLVYPTVEHAYQAAKTLDTAQRERIQVARSPSQAKRLGQSVRLRPDWETTKLTVMYELNKQKYSKPLFKKLLLSTGIQTLQESNTWHDTFWGIDIYTSVGRNHLGMILMRIRDELLSMDSSHGGDPQTTDD